MTLHSAKRVRDAAVARPSFDRREAVAVTESLRCRPVHRRGRRWAGFRYCRVQPVPCAGWKGGIKLRAKFQALVDDILPSTTAVLSCAIGFRKLSANEHFFVGAQTVVSLLQTTQIKQGVSFIAASKVYTGANKTTIVWIETELFFLPGWGGWGGGGGDASHVYVPALALLGCFYSRISTHTPSIAFRHLPPNSARFSYATASVDSCVEIKSAHSLPPPLWAGLA